MSELLSAINELISVIQNAQNQSVLEKIGIGTIIGATISAIFVFISSNKKNELDYVTKERSEWRETLKKIVVNIATNEVNKNDKEVNKNDKDNKRLVEKSIEQLKARLNPYGRYFEYTDKNKKQYYLNDGHIWEAIRENDTKRLVEFIHLLLKHDWERSKLETKIFFLKYFSKKIYII